MATAGAQTAAPAKAEVCVACHWPAGKSTLPQFPVLAGQTSRYLYLQLRDYQEGRRSNELMTPMVAGLSREKARVAGQHYDYIVKQLSDFKARKRTNDAGNMTSVSNTLSATDIENLGHYLAGL